MDVQIADLDNLTGKQIEWPEGMPVPKIGETVVDRKNRSLYVTGVVYYPHGGDGQDEPFILVQTSRQSDGFARI